MNTIVPRLPDLLPFEPGSVWLVGAGPGGLACAVTAAQRGHRVTLFEADDRIGGQLNWAIRVPGKGEFRETLRYFRRQLELHEVETRREWAALPEHLREFDEVVLATGVIPRVPSIAGVDHPSVLTYLDVLKDPLLAGERVAIVGAGGIGFDVAELLSTDTRSTAEDIPAFLHEWGIDRTGRMPGGLAEGGPAIRPCRREIVLLQRRIKKVGADLGRTTGWIHRERLKARGVQMLNAVRYERIDDHGLHITVSGQARLLEVDTVVLCAGQEPNRDLARALAVAQHHAQVAPLRGQAREIDHYPQRRVFRQRA